MTGRELVGVGFLRSNTVQFIAGVAGSAFGKGAAQAEEI
jgi:hypothetical protein